MCKCNLIAPVHGAASVEQWIESLILYLGPLPVGEMKVCINCWVHTAQTTNQPLYINQPKWILKSRTPLRSGVVFIIRLKRSVKKKKVRMNYFWMLSACALGYLI